jgi:hypothetical protein
MLDAEEATAFLPVKHEDDGAPTCANRSLSRVSPCKRATTASQFALDQSQRRYWKKLFSRVACATCLLAAIWFICTSTDLKPLLRRRPAKGALLPLPEVALLNEQPTTNYTQNLIPTLRYVTTIPAEWYGTCQSF